MVGESCGDCSRYDSRMDAESFSSSESSFEDGWTLDGR